MKHVLYFLRFFTVISQNLSGNFAARLFTVLLQVFLQCN